MREKLTKDLERIREIIDGLDKQGIDKQSPAWKAIIAWHNDVVHELSRLNMRELKIKAYDASAAPVAVRFRLRIMLQEIVRGFETLYKEPKCSTMGNYYSQAKELLNDIDNDNDNGL